jgi:CheY-specific phosphatase CheX
MEYNILEVGSTNTKVYYCKDKELLTIANPYARETFQLMDDDAFDSVCEFINCTNGLFASKLSQRDIQVDMEPPLFYTGKRLLAKGSITVVPVIIDGTPVDLLFSVDNPVEIN